MKETSGRRRFLKSAAALGAVIPAGAAAQSKPAPTPHADHDKQHAQHMRAAATAARPYMFLSQTEVAFLDAAVSHLIPKDELGPGAKEAGVTYFIDQQLFGGYNPTGTVGALTFQALEAIKTKYLKRPGALA